jgi:hypothetical protein
MTTTYTYGRSRTDKAWGLRRACHDHIIALRTQQGGQARTIGRSVFYAMVATKVVPKSRAPQPGNKGAKQPDQEVSEALTWLREKGLVGWDEIADESRSVIDRRGFATVAEGVDALLDQVRLDPWDGNPPVVVVESRSLASLVSDITYTYRVASVPLGGQSSGGFLANEVAELLGPKTPVLYLGDWDKAGGDIEASAERRLSRFAPDWNGTWERLAVTDPQALQLQALWITKTDQRNHRQYQTLEAEALGPVELRRILDDALDAMLPTSLRQIEAKEKRQRQAIRRKLQ